MRTHARNSSARRRLFCLSHAQGTALAAVLALGLAGHAAAADFMVEPRQVEDTKLVYATVQATVEVPARARISGTLESLGVDEGSSVDQGETIARIVDEKLTLQARALEASIEAARSQVTKAELDYERAQQLYERGTLPKSNIDQLETALVVARNSLKAAEAERAVLDQQMTEGNVLAPAAGRVLNVPVTAGSVVMAGEVVATVAKDGFLLRLEVPERHARFMEVGDPVRLGAAELGDDAGHKGEIVKIFPKITGGRVVADAKVDGLGDFFVGERTQAMISVGTREAIIIPARYVSTRFGLDFVHLARTGQDPLDIVVELGVRHRTGNEEEVEVLSGLEPGDTLVMP